MEKIVEIVFGDSLYFTMKNSSLNQNKIIKFNTLFSVADLSEIDKYILKVPAQILINNEYDFSKEITQLKELTLDNDVRIWCSHNDSDSYILLLYLCDYLKDKVKSVHVIFSDEINKEYISPSVMDEKELENATSYKHILNYNQMEPLSKEWLKIKNTNCELRIMRNGQVKLVNYSFYDDIILNLLKNLEPCKVSVLVAHLLGEYDHICDIIYSFLIDRLITNNKIKLIKENKDRFFDSIVSLNDEM